MRLIYADYNMQTNSIDVTTFSNYVLRIDCNKAEIGLRTMPVSQYALNHYSIFTIYLVLNKWSSFRGVP